MQKIKVIHNKYLNRKYYIQKSDYDKKAELEVCFTCHRKI